MLNVRDWLASHWPVQYGGPGCSVVQRFFFEFECALADAPRVVPFGVNMLGSDVEQFWYRSAKTLLITPNLEWCELIVSGLFRVERGLGSRGSDEPCAPRGWASHRSRPNDLGDVRSVRKHEFLPCRHEPRGEKARRHQLFCLLI